MPATALEKRAPPFTQDHDPTADNIPSHLGNYTHSHEDIEPPTYTCTPIGECDVCTPFEKVSGYLVVFIMHLDEL